MTIEKNTGDIGGEMTDLYLIPSNHIETVPETDSDFEKDFSDFELKSGKSFENIYFSPQSGNFSENQSHEDPGELFKKTMSFKIPKNRSEVSLWMKQKSKYRFTALVRSSDGTWYYVGPNLQLQYMRVIPDNADKYNGYEVSMQGNDSESCTVLTNVSL